ncbi:hypothetical protein [Mesorhizobium sp. M7A.F.Ca.US.008.03.1.1]|uniref:hypothetical protein n=1 Tax=Mesorhizobium sp. M7A.F.Ca.US.008.03.1.1 TaxID=2496742 RepID=UPI0019D276E4|nr:hypothetical protein [Mesorhizobium sp. M7A.F.Ca.US.008.03.1.1]
MDASSELGIPNLLITILGFIVVYGVLAVIEVRLMLQAIAKGPAVGADIAPPVGDRTRIAQ